MVGGVGHLEIVLGKVRGGAGLFGLDVEKLARWEE